jgi:hypothetical protein
MNLILSAATPQKSGTGQTGATLKGGIVPEGFALLAGRKASAEVPVLPGDTATTKTAVASSVLLEASGAPAVSSTVAVPETALPEDRNFDQSLQTAVTQPVANDLLLQQQALLSGRTQVEPVHQLTAQTNGATAITAQLANAVNPIAPMAHADVQGSQAPATQPAVNGPMSGQQVLKSDTPVQQLTAQAGSAASVVAQPVSVGKSAEAPIPTAAIAQPPNHQMVAQQIGSGTTSPLKALGNQVQAAVAPTQAEQYMVEPGRQSVPKPENSNRAPPILSDGETVAQQLPTAKATGDHDTTKSVAALKPAELGVTQTPKVQQANPTANSANTNVTATPVVDTTPPLPEVARQAAMVSQTHVLPQAANVDRKQPADQARIAAVTALSDTAKPANMLAEGSSAGPAEQGQRTAQLPVAMVDIFAKPAALGGQEKPAIGMGEPFDVLDRAQTAPVSVLAPDNATATTKTVLAQEANPKVAPKPFTEALMAQVKSVEVREGQTTVNLVPRGLGNIEVEIISEKDVASRVVVRVENPAVLQSLRDDRNLLAQAIGVSDSSIFDFQEQSAGDQSDPQHNQNGQNGDPLGDTIATDLQRQHLDVVHEGQLDILT